MKTCPVCGARCFDDMEVCYGCMHRFDARGEASTMQAAAFETQDDAVRTDGGVGASSAAPATSAWRPGKPSSQDDPAVRDEPAARAPYAFGLAHEDAPARPAPGVQAAVPAESVRAAFVGQAGASACQGPCGLPHGAPASQSAFAAADVRASSGIQAPSAAGFPPPSAGPGPQAAPTTPPSAVPQGTGAASAPRPFMQGMSVASPPFSIGPSGEGACYQVVVTLRPCARPSSEGRPTAD